MNAIVTVVGQDRVGIIAAICVRLSSYNINILDISQTILQDFFNMIMIVDAGKCDMTFAELSAGLKNVGENIGVTITCQKEEIFEMVHRI